MRFVNKVIGLISKSQKQSCSISFLKIQNMRSLKKLKSNPVGFKTIKSLEN